MDKPVLSANKILIVDDEPSIREALQIFFEDRGYSVSRAENGAEALSYIEKEDFDLVLSDIRMDKLDGIDLIKRMAYYNEKTPVVLITAYPEVKSAIEALRHGAAEYIIKPFEMKELERKISAIISDRRSSSSEALNEAVKKQKKDFLSRFSREIREPLTPIAAYVKLLLKNEFGDISKRQAEVIKKIEKNGKRLKYIADDLIQLYALEYAGDAPVIKKTPISQLLKDAVEEEDMFIREKKQNVDARIFDGLEEVACDREKICRVLHHLIDNAVKFSPTTSRISLTVRKYVYAGEPFIKFSIRDGSEKLSFVSKRLLFRRFYDMPQLEEEHEGNPSGLGLGLTLSKAIVEAHKGKIWLEEAEEDAERGNIFSFILPG